MDELIGPLGDLSEISEKIFHTDFSIPCEIALRWMLQDLTDN